MVSMEEKNHNPPLLYNLNKDASEKYDISKEYPGVIKKINQIVSEHKTKNDNWKRSFN